MFAAPVLPFDGRSYGLLGALEDVPADFIDAGIFATENDVKYKVKSRMERCGGGTEREGLPFQLLFVSQQFTSRHFIPTLSPQPGHFDQLHVYLFITHHAVRNSNVENDKRHRLFFKMLLYHFDRTCR